MFISEPAALRYKRWIWRPDFIVLRLYAIFTISPGSRTVWKTSAGSPRCCVATDVPDNFDLDINTAYALVRGTTKPIATSFFVADHIRPVVRLFDLVDGAEGGFSRRPWCFAHISPIISPFRYGADAVEVALECVRYNLPVNCITAAQSGATGPAPPAAFLAASTAETLASLIMVNVFYSRLSDDFFKLAIRRRFALGRVLWWRP